MARLSLRRLFLVFLAVSHTLEWLGGPPGSINSCQSIFSSPFSSQFLFQNVIQCQAVFNQRLVLLLTKRKGSGEVEGGVGGGGVFQ